jgi:predicted cupin superfamily sugar epimerase
VQFVEEQPTPWGVGLKPLTVDYQLRNCPLAHVAHQLRGSSRIDVNIDFRVHNPMRIEELLCRAAIPAPRSRIDLHLHISILAPAFRACASARILLPSAHMTADEIKALLNLQPHPIEGGSFRRTYTSAISVDLPRGTRPAGTAIYYLLERGTFSEMHVLDSDEIFHFYLGDSVEMLQLRPDGRSEVFTLGPDLQAGQHVQLVVPAGVWQGTRLIGEGKVALLGCTVTPGFDFADYRNASYAELVEKWPAESVRIKSLTRS